MKNLFIFIFNNIENIEDNNIINYINTINYYKDYYDNFCVLENNINNNNLFNKIIRYEKLSTYYKLESNININFFILNNLINIDYNNFIFIDGYNLDNNIIYELKNNIFNKDINNFNLSLKNFKYYIIKKDDLIEIKKKYLL
jgi:hypothetical protein